jgi:hypothetical protein
MTIPARAATAWLLALYLPLLGQAVRVLPAVDFPGATFTTEVSWEPAARGGKPATAIQFDIIYPAQLLELDASGPILGAEGARADKILACSAHSSYSYGCLLAGGQKPVGNGPMAVFHFKIRPDARPGTSAFRIEKVQAVAADLSRIEVKDSDAAIVVRNPAAAQAGPFEPVADRGPGLNPNPVWTSMEPYLEALQTLRSSLDFEHARGMLASAQNALEATRQGPEPAPVEVAVNNPPAPAATAPVSEPPAPEPVESPAAVHNRNGRELLNHYKLREAIDELSEAIRLDAGFAQAFNARGFAHYLRKEYPKALADLNEAIRLDPGYKNAYTNRSALRSAMGDGKGASEDKRRAR